MKKNIWVCDYGHEIAVTSNQPLPKACPECDRRRKLGMPLNEDMPTEWKCAKGHKIFASYNQIAQGAGCPICEASEGNQ